MMSKTGILLESGTNELEIVEFQINYNDEHGNIVPSYYGVNVAKVKEIIKTPPKFSDVPKAHPSIIGVINLRGKIIPIVNLPQWLDKEDDGSTCKRVIITEFNRILTGFMVHEVARIHRVSWTSVETPAGIMNQAEKECITGMVKFDEKILMMLDFERIVSEINPDMGRVSKIDIRSSGKRAGKTIFIAEDSAFVRKQMSEMLKTAGYRVFTASNGREALTKLTTAAEEARKSSRQIKSYLNLIITDIEMPAMDGLHLVTNLKKHDVLKDVPVVVYSSLVTDENKKKWKSIGVDHFLSKPDLAKLVHHVDRLAK
ncbi:MAG: chemotaxis protein [Nitrospinota bacterium]|nr:chemotaxis protein [Nitrospinota bacterium]